MLALAVVLISLALVSYTTGVLAERRSGTLKVWHAVAFGTGLVFDATGTQIMSMISDSSASANFATTPTASLLSNLMVITGAAALLLMALHFVWAVVVLFRNREKEKATFHKFSLGVWPLWLVPYFTGMAAAMA
ncbi:Uncharacterised protein [Actinomyces bovis]|uniref:TIGR03987 family protein n=1 Tax=Actinomyces bovis TaxID=1658 RepID=A0ABY1VPY1_9ACTO|nr:HsmA family protein [Actinomyces bovis]SPT54184.1 Uncharacterised protein [Actinomyces bovis]VEG56588.1 Uncharacterised protein [Actinomyces israelii]